jgi:hypothetical protein
METKEIAMQKRTTMMGTACVLAAAALTAGPAAAATLTDFAGALNTSFTNSDNSASGSESVKSWLLGGSAAMPLSTLDGLNAQVDASYTHNWSSGNGTHFSREDWNFGGSAFWANMDSRIGINGSYTNYNEFGHLTNGGLLGEYYFGAITAMAKGGWLWGGGSAFGGHGNYLGGAVAGYILPDLAITGGVEWADLITGQGCQICGRSDARDTAFEIAVEFLFSEDLGLSGYAGYTYQSQKFSGFSDTHNNVWHVGVRWYMGGGSLMDHHRNGNLNPWLPGLSSASLAF